MSDIKSLLDILEEYSEEETLVEAQDSFDIELGEDLLIETGVVDITEDGIVVEGDEETLKLLAEHGVILEDTDWSKYDEPTVSRIAKGITKPVDRTDYNTPPAMRDTDQGKPGYEKRRSRIMKGLEKVGEGHADQQRKVFKKNGKPVGEVGIDRESSPGVGQWYMKCYAYDIDYSGYDSYEEAVAELKHCLKQGVAEGDKKEPLKTHKSNCAYNYGHDCDCGGTTTHASNCGYNYGHDCDCGKGKDNHGDKKKGEIDEAKYQGREVPLGKPMAGDVKKSKVYVRKPNGKVVKVNFGDKNMKIKKSNPKRRKSFRARHNCKNPGPRWKARYWSCRAW